MKLNTFLGLVLTSVEELKSNSTPEQRKRLDISELDPTLNDTCILAQMTGNSNSVKARMLAAKNVFLEVPKNIDVENYYNGNVNRYYINALEYMVHKQRYETGLAAFEWFIMFEGANTEELIQYIKGETTSFLPRIEVPVELEA